MGVGIRLEPRSAPLVLNSILALLLMYYATLRMPLAGILLTALVPLPIILVSRRVGLAWGLAVVGAAFAFIASLKFFGGIASEFLLFAQMAVAGLLLSMWERRGAPVEATIGLTVLVLTLINAAAVVFTLVSQDLTPQAYVNRLVKDMLGSLTGFMQKEGADLKDLLPEGVERGVFEQVLMRISPALLVMNSTLVVWLNVLLSRGILAQTAEPTETPPLSLWEAPGWFIFVFVGAGFLTLMPMDWVHTAGLNFLLLGALAYFFQGLAIISHTFQKFQVPRFLRIMTYPWLVLLKPAMVLVVILGLTDLWLDYRRLYRPSAEE